MMEGISNQTLYLFVDNPKMQEATLEKYIQKCTIILVPQFQISIFMLIDKIFFGCIESIHKSPSNAFIRIFISL